MKKTTRRTALAGLGLAILGASLAMGGGLALAALLWSPTSLSIGQGDHRWILQQAANWTEDGYTDWRLPTPDEFVAGVNNGSIAPLLPSANASYWTSRKKGSWGYSVKVRTDANGIPDPATVQINRDFWNAGRYAKFVRP